MKRQGPIVGGARVAFGKGNTLLTQRISEGQLTRYRILIKRSSMCTSALNIVTLNQTETLPLRRIERTMPVPPVRDIGCLPGGGVPDCGGGDLNQLEWLSFLEGHLSVRQAKWGSATNVLSQACALWAAHRFLCRVRVLGSPSTHETPHRCEAGCER